MKAIKYLALVASLYSYTALAETGFTGRVVCKPDFALELGLNSTNAEGLSVVIYGNTGDIMDQGAGQSIKLPQGTRFMVEDRFVHESIVPSEENGDSIQLIRNTVRTIWYNVKIIDINGGKIEGLSGLVKGNSCHDDYLIDGNRPG